MYRDFRIDQLVEDCVIGDKVIPKGYVNATQMCLANKKRLDNYLANKNTIAFLEVAQTHTVPWNSSERYAFQASADQVIVVQGGDIQGTWVSLKVALHLATWISPDFANWAFDVLVCVVNGDFAPLTAEAAEAEKRFIETWRKWRSSGIGVRRTLTDSIQQWYIDNPGGTKCPEHAMYSRVTDAIYLALWGKKAVEIEVVLGCTRHQSRDNLSAKCLQILERAEDAVMDFIDLDNIKPIDVVAMANIRPSRVPIEHK
jgi:hypothetical protein